MKFRSAVLALEGIKAKMEGNQGTFISFQPLIETCADSILHHIRVKHVEEGECDFAVHFNVFGVKVCAGYSPTLELAKARHEKVLSFDCSGILSRFTVTVSQKVRPEHGTEYTEPAATFEGGKWN